MSKIDKDLFSLISSYDEPDELISELEDKTIAIKNCIKSIQNNFIRIGWLLRDIRNSKDFKNIEYIEMGRNCKNIYEYAKQEFNFCKSTTISLIAIVNEFSKYRDRLDEDYYEYNYSQLVEMTSLSKEQLTLCNPSMTEQEIRALKKIKKIDQLTGQNLEKDKKIPLQRFYKLKTDEERLNFKTNYSKWRVISKTPELNLVIYECKINNGDSLICFEYLFFDKQRAIKSSSTMLIRKYANGTMPFEPMTNEEYLTYIRPLEVEFEPSL